MDMRVNTSPLEVYGSRSMGEQYFRGRLFCQVIGFKTQNIVKETFQVSRPGSTAYSLCTLGKYL